MDSGSANFHFLIFEPKKKDRPAAVSLKSDFSVRYRYNSPHFHTKIEITITIPIMIPNIFSFVTRLAFAS
jgi:hypothetical protein